MEENFLGSFEWDEEKRLTVLEKHGIDFEDVVGVFKNNVMTTSSRHDGEQRWIAVGLLNGIMIAVVYTMRGDTCRLITARRARRNERKEYHARYLGAGP